MMQGIRGKDMAVSVQGLYLAGSQGLGEFGLVAQNAKTIAAAKPNPTSGAYKLTGYKWFGDDPNIKILLSTDALPTGFSDVAKVKNQISAAQGEWDGYSSKDLFYLLDTTTGGTSMDSMDGRNVHLWTNTGLASGTIAMTGTWYNTLTKQAVESDCWYNNNLKWRIDSDGVGKESSFDIRTIATHELGHTLGLADLYQDRYKYQTMYGYNDGTADWTLASGDIAGVQKLYGA
jgi:hypothetical protein